MNLPQEYNRFFHEYSSNSRNMRITSFLVPWRYVIVLIKILQQIMWRNTKGICSSTSDSRVNYAGITTIEQSCQGSTILCTSMDLTVLKLQQHYVNVN
jgi:hypothetical protein